MKLTRQRLYLKNYVHKLCNKQLNDQRFSAWIELYIVYIIKNVFDALKSDFIDIYKFGTFF